MAGIKVTLIDAVTNKSYIAELPIDIPISRLIPALIAKLELPLIGPNGYEIDYCLNIGQGTKLTINDTRTLYSTGIQKDSDILITYILSLLSGR